MEQRTFADLEFEAKKRVTRREKFLARMGADDSMGVVGDTDSALLPETGAGAASLPPVDDAAHPLRPVVLQSERSGDGGSAL